MVCPGTLLYPSGESPLYSLLLLILFAALGAVPGNAQTPVRTKASAGTISGTVVDAATSGPLVGAAVTLEPRAMGAFPMRTPGASAFIRATRATTTDTGGYYHFSGLPEGEYRLHVQRIGYRPTSVGVELRGAADSRVSVGLNVEAVPLQPLQVSVQRPAGAAADSYGRTAAPGREGDARIAAERTRQERHLSSDVRTMTHADVVQGVTLAETDLFRALQRLPGVSARDEYSAELWTRGAPSDQTRVYFDGLPLFNPVHGLGLFAGVNPDAVGAAFLHPGVQPASSSGGTAGALDLRTRRGGQDGTTRGLGELSLASGRFALDGSVSSGDQAWMIAGRRTYLDWVTGVAEDLLGRDRTYQFPYDFYDLTSRYDRRLGNRGALEISGLLQRDDVGNDNGNILNGVAARWGGGALRTTLQLPLAGVQTRHTAGFSGFRSSASKWEEGRWQPLSEYDDVVQSNAANQRQSNQIAYYTLEGEIQPAGSRAWSAGYGIVGQSVNFNGPRPTPFAPLQPEAYTLSRQDQLAYGTLWGERRWTPLNGLSVETGLRVDLGLPDAPARWAPRMSTRFQLTPGTSLSAAAGRTYQYIQALAPAGPSAEEGFRTDYLWVLAGSGTPTVRADIATLGAETWVGDWLGSITTYLRRSDGIAMPDPTPGSVLNRPLFLTGENRARGVDMSLRRLAGPYTASAAYSYGISEISAMGQRFPAPEDQRHVFDATAMVRLDSRWQLGAAYTAASGAPYTRTFRGATVCTQEGSCTWGEEPWLGDPGALRTRSHQSLDLLLDWNRSYRKWTLGAYLQIRNALNHSNSGRYLGYRGMYLVGSCDYRQAPCVWEPRDEFLPGMPILPLVGFRASF